MRRIFVLCVCLYWGLSALAQNYGEFQPDSYTQGLWLLNESTGTSVADSSGNAHNGTAASTQTIVNGWFGKARNFGGGYVSFVDHADFTFSHTGNNTWEFVANFDTLNSWAVLWYQGGGSADLYVYVGDAYNTDGVTAWFIDTTDRVADTVNSALTTGTWYYIAIVHNGTADTVRIYINGVDRTSSSSVALATTNDPSTIWLGGDNVYGDRLDGTIDMVRIRYGYEASAAEIRHTWNTLKGAYGIIE